MLTGRVAGEEADGGGVWSRHCRGSEARASELRMQKDAPGPGELACVLREARGGAGSPESAGKAVGDSEVRRGIRAAWGRAKVGRQRGRREEGETL